MDKTSRKRRKKEVCKLKIKIVKSSQKHLEICLLGFSIQEAQSSEIINNFDLKIMTHWKQLDLPKKSLKMKSKSIKNIFKKFLKINKKSKQWLEINRKCIKLSLKTYLKF